MKNRFLAVDDQSVSGVVTTLKAHDGVRTLGEEVDDRTLPFVTPLRADNDDVCAHSLASNEKEHGEPGDDYA